MMMVLALGWTGPSRRQRNAAAEQVSRQYARYASSLGKNASLVMPHTGHRQSSGMSAKGVPGGMPCSGSPHMGSYS